MLYLVATPIGNLEDITLRALKILRKVDLILAEDTRVTRKLLSRYDIHTKLESFHQYTNQQRIIKITQELQAGREIALLTDAGTPCISDPGLKLLKNLPAETKLSPIPGPSALTASASVAGMDVNKFLFLGFLPRKKRRKKSLAEIENSQHTVIFYESPYRIKKTLKELGEILGERKICICRELTKIFETIYYGQAGDLVNEIMEKGEFVVVIEGKK